MAVSETFEVAVMEVWLIDSPDPKINTSWATKGPLQLFCTWCSLVHFLGWVVQDKRPSSPDPPTRSLMHLCSEHLHSRLATWNGSL